MNPNSDGSMPSVDQSGKPLPGGKPQGDLSTSDSGNSGDSKTKQGGPGTASSIEQATPGAPKPPK
jgi:hypothetical protein